MYLSEGVLDESTLEEAGVLDRVGLHRDEGAELVAVADGRQCLLEVGHLGRQLEHVDRDILGQLDRQARKAVDVLLAQETIEEGMETPLVVSLVPVVQLQHWGSASRLVVDRQSFHLLL